MTSVDVKIVANPSTIAQPWIWRLSRDFELQVNIKKANIDTDFGWALVELSGPVEEIQRATAWLMTTGMHIEAQKRAVGA